MWLGSGVAVAVVWASGCSSSSTPNLRTYISCKFGPKKKKKKEKKESELVVAQGWEVMTKGYSMFFWGSEDVLNLIVVVVAQLCQYTKNHWIVHFKWMNCVACELHPNKDLTPKKKRYQWIFSLAVYERPHPATSSPALGCHHCNFIFYFIVFFAIFLGCSHSIWRFPG